MAEAMTTEDLDAGNAVTRSALERSQLVARALGEAARRARFSTRGRRALAGGGFYARRGERAMRIFVLVSFVLVAVIPSLVGAIYYGLVASNQYVSEARFAVRGGTAPKLDTLGALTGFPSLEIVQDTQIIINYVVSRAIVETLQSQVGLIGRFSRPEVDYFSRLGPDEPIEKVVRYWKSMIDFGVQLPSGIVTVSVRAFTPQDSVTIARAVLDASERLVNDMNARMRQDALTLTAVEQQRARDRLATTRAAMEQGRNEEGLLSAESALEAQNKLIVNERTNLLKMQQDYETQRQYLGEAAPQLRALKKRIDAEKEQIAQLEAQLTRRPDAKSETKVLSGSMNRLQYLDLEREIAEKAYATALTSHERARLAAETQLLYLNTFVRPLEAQQSRYPKRWLTIGIIIGASFAAWATLIGVLVLVRNHRAR
jgi:capsular polysaccharide transport system permease protein